MFQSYPFSSFSPFPDGRCALVLCASPCQSFSGSNRNVDHNSEKDLYRKRLSFTLIDSVIGTGALVGVLENVEGMWRRPNVYFLKKIVLEFLRAGYQVRVRLHRAHFFGDPVRFDINIDFYCVKPG